MINNLGSSKFRLILILVNDDEHIAFFSFRIRQTAAVIFGGSDGGSIEMEIRISEPSLYNAERIPESTYIIVAEKR